MRRMIAIALAASGLAACNTEMGGPPPTGPHYAPPPGSEAFSEADFGWSTGSGGSSIDGSLGYRAGAGKFTCSDVVLAPETPWSRARMRVLYESTTSAVMPADDVRGRTPPEHSNDYAHYARHATCDAGGHFSFAGLPSGGWYVITVATPAGGGPKLAIMRHVVTRGGSVSVSLR